MTTERRLQGFFISCPGAGPQLRLSGPVMKSIADLLADLRSRADCHFTSATHLPSIPPDLQLPLDLAAFYQQFSEANLFSDDGIDPPCRLVPPAEFVPVGIAIMGEPPETRIERSWYAVADVRDGNYLAIDLLPSRLGRCYDCFHESYGEPGYCTVIALSFTELLNRIAEAEGNAFWLDEDFEGYGDAYDDV